MMFVGVQVGKALLAITMLLSLRRNSDEQAKNKGGKEANWHEWGQMSNCWIVKIMNFIKSPKHGGS